MLEFFRFSFAIFLLWGCIGSEFRSSFPDLSKIPPPSFRLKENLWLIFANQTDPQELQLFLERSVQALKPRLEASPLMEEKIRILNTYFFQEQGFTFDAGDPLGENPDNVHLLRVIQRKKGFCLSLSVLYLLIGQELKLPLYGVKAPHHFFLRCEPSGNSFFNIESTNTGLPFPNSYYVENFRIGSKALLHEYYLRNLNEREVFAEYVSNYLVRWPPPPEVTALELYQQAVQLSPHSPEVHFNYANTLYQNQHFEEALQMYDQTIQLNEINPEAFSQRGVVYGKLNQKERALNDFKIALLLAPEDQSTLWNRALLFHRENEFELAQQDYLTLLQQNKKHAGAHYHLALIYLEQKDPEMARKHASEAVYLEPNNQKYQDFFQKVDKHLKQHRPLEENPYNKKHF